MLHCIGVNHSRNELGNLAVALRSERWASSNTLHNRSLLRGIGLEGTMKGRRTPRVGSGVAASWKVHNGDVDSSDTWSSLLGEDGDACMLPNRRAGNRVGLLGSAGDDSTCDRVRGGGTPLRVGRGLPLTGDLRGSAGVTGVTGVEDGSNLLRAVGGAKLEASPNGRSCTEAAARTSTSVFRATPAKLWFTLPEATGVLGCRRGPARRRGPLVGRLTDPFATGTESVERGKSLAGGSEITRRAGASVCVDCVRDAGEA